MNKSFVLAEVKTVDSKEPSGEFEAIISAPTLDRDGEIIDAGAFQKGPGGLPASIPIHAFHDFNDPIGRGTPEYRDDVLYVRGKFASTPRAQEIRSLVAEGVVANMSVGFMAPEREAKDGVTHILAAELLEASFVSVSSNREAAVLAVKAVDVKAGRTLSAKNENTLRQAAELINGVLDQLQAASDEDSAGDKTPAATDPEEKTAAPEAAADPPADVPVGQAYAAIARAQAALLTT